MSRVKAINKTECITIHVMETKCFIFFYSLPFNVSPNFLSMNVRSVRRKIVDVIKCVAC